MNTYGKTYSGTYTPIHPEKYIGDITKIIWRSLWEKKAMVYFDENPGIVSWSSEELAVKYYNPVKKRQARYFPDFIIKVKSKSGSMKTYMVEIKPKSKSQPPVKRGKVSKRFVAETLEWEINKAKWAAAENYCKDYGMSFKILTEKDLNITF